VRRPVTALDFILLENRSLALTPRQVPEINSRSCFWVSPRSRDHASGRVISSSQRPQPDNTQHSRQHIRAPVGFEATISAGELPQTYTLDRAATGTGIQST